MLWPQFSHRFETVFCNFSRPLDDIHTGAGRRQSNRSGAYGRLTTIRVTRRKFAFQERWPTNPLATLWVAEVTESARRSQPRAEQTVLDLTRSHGDRRDGIIINSRRYTYTALYSIYCSEHYWTAETTPRRPTTLHTTRRRHAR